MTRLRCLLFGCYIDMGDGSEPFECARCGAVPDNPDAYKPRWMLGLPPLRSIYRTFNGW